MESNSPAMPSGLTVSTKTKSQDTTKSVKELELPEISETPKESIDCFLRTSAKVCDVVGKAAAPHEMISGTKIVPYDKNRRRIALSPSKSTNFYLADKRSVSEHRPVVYSSSSQVQIASDFIPERTNCDSSTDSKKRKQHKVTEIIKEDPKSKGIINYALSDLRFVENGWTQLPVLKTYRLISVYRMAPPPNNWFEVNRDKSFFYDNGDMLASVDDDGSGRWYYRNRHLALSLTMEQRDGCNVPSLELSRQKFKFTVYDCVPKPRNTTKSSCLNGPVLATFDYIGNGFVFDSSGNVRLQYNQNSGVVIDPTIGVPGRLPWHSTKDDRVCEIVLANHHLEPKDPVLAKMQAKGDAETPPKNPSEERMLMIETNNFSKSFRNYDFNLMKMRTKTIKINDYFTLHILDQTKIYLYFRNGRHVLKVNVGLKLMKDEILNVNQVDESKLPVLHELGFNDEKMVT